MFCPYCGNPCADTHKFCFRCGKPLPELTTTEPIQESTPKGSDALTSTEAIFSETEAAIAAMPAAEPSETVETPTEETADEDPFPVPEAPAESVSQTRKGRLWPPLLALSVMACLGLAAFFLTPKAPEPVRSCFTAESGVLYFDPTLYTGGEELTVPSTVDGMAVTGISMGCFADCDNLTTIILPETVTIIGDKAFSGCDSLRGIYIPEGVLSIGSDALAGCINLEAVSIPASVMEVGEGCLDQCASLHYLFYGGTYAQWRELYDGDYPAGMELHTTDGTFYAQP